MSLNEILNAALADTTVCADEAQWVELWQARGLNKADALTMAVAGGARADRLAWVFLAGYQASMRTLLGNRMTGFAALVASEDREDPEAHPGPRLQPDGSGWRLSGFKSWVAASQHLQQMIVSVRAPSEDKPRTWVTVDCSQPGVRLSHREAPRFLPQLSQGFAQFDNVALSAEQLLTGLSVGDFRHIESCHVRLASIAFLLRFDPQDAELRALLPEFARLCEPGGRLDPALTARLDACIEHLDPRLQNLPNYASDRRMLTMYRAVEQQPTRG